MKRNMEWKTVFLEQSKMRECFVNWGGKAIHQFKFLLDRKKKEIFSLFK